MSLAKKCDRCKSCFDPYNLEGRMGRFINPIFQTSDEIREQYRGQLLDEDLGVDGIIDLCPKCAVEFRKFMNHPEAEIPVNPIADVFTDALLKMCNFRSFQRHKLEDQKLKDKPSEE